MSSYGLKWRNKMKGGDVYQEVVLMTACYSPDAGGCNGCYYQSKGYVSAGHENDPCNLCEDDFIFEKSVRLMRVIG